MGKLAYSRVPRWFEIDGVRRLGGSSNKTIGVSCSYVYYLGREKDWPLGCHNRIYIGGQAGNEFPTRNAKADINSNGRLEECISVK